MMVKDDPRLDRLEQRLQSAEDVIRETRQSLMAMQSELRGGWRALVIASGVIAGLVALVVGVTRLLQWAGGKAP